MKKSLFILSLGLVGLWSCKPEDVTTADDKQYDADVALIKEYVAKQPNASSYKSVESGMHYVHTVSNPTGKALGAGYTAKFKYDLFLLNGTRVDSSTATAYFDNTAYLKNAQGFTTPIAPNVPGIAQALYFSKEGESGSFIIASGWGLGTSTKNNVPANSILRLELNVLEYQDEEAQIEAYLKANNLTAEKTSSGLRYIVLQKGSETATKAGTNVEVNYSGKLLYNNTEFDKGTFPFNLGSGQVIKGFDEGVLKMKIGEKARFLIPQALGYGTSGAGSGKIPPYATLIFDIEVVK